MGPGLLVVAYANQRLRAFVPRTRAAACLRRGTDFFAEPLRAEVATTRRAGFALACRLTLGPCFSLGRFSVLLPEARALAGLTGFEAFGDATAEEITFSARFGGDDFDVLRTSLPGTAAGGGAAAAGTTDAAFVLPFGRPPFLANWASASILRNASCASAIS